MRNTAPRVCRRGLSNRRAGAQARRRAGAQARRDTGTQHAHIIGNGMQLTVGFGTGNNDRWKCILDRPRSRIFKNGLHYNAT